VSARTVNPSASIDVSSPWGWGPAASGEKMASKEGTAVIMLTAAVEKYSGSAEGE
jgi:hypothetical protein